MIFEPKPLNKCPRGWAVWNEQKPCYPIQDQCRWYPSVSKAWHHEQTMKNVKSMKNQSKSVKSDKLSVKCCKTNANTTNFKICWSFFLTFFVFPLVIQHFTLQLSLFTLFVWFFMLFTLFMVCRPSGGAQISKLGGLQQRRR